MNNKTNYKKPWYQNNFWIIAFLIFFFPVGLYLMWRYSSWKKQTKIIVSCVFVFIIVMLIISYFVSPPTIDVYEADSDNTITSQTSNYTIKGSITGVGNVTLSADNKKISMDSYGNFSYSVKLNNGVNRFTFVAKNYNGSTKTICLIKYSGKTASQKSVKSNPVSNSVASNNSEIAIGSQTNDIMAGIKESNAENDPYNRDDYEPSWSVDSGCDIRSRILSSTSTIQVKFGSNGCTVKYGSWVDPYSGQTLTGNPYRGDGTANDLDIDHVIPLKYVNEHGGYEWSSSQKQAYGHSLSAMANGVYLAVSASENEQKSDYGPAEWYPPNSGYRCTYAQKWHDIAKVYNISLAPSDYNLIRKILSGCSS